jgi:hypothetical protein
MISVTFVGPFIGRTKVLPYDSHDRTASGLAIGQDERRAEALRYNRISLACRAGLSPATEFHSLAGQDLVLRQNFTHS